MKNIKKTLILISLSLVIIIAFSSCSFSSLASALIGDASENDPASVLAGDVLGKTTKSTGLFKGGFAYSLYEDDTAVITGFADKNNTEGAEENNEETTAADKKGAKKIDVVIPGEIDGHEVIAVENKAFYDDDDIRSLTLADSVQVIGNYAFMFCDSLETVVFGKNIKNLGTSSFQGTQKEAYIGNGSLKKITFNGAPDEIGEKAFYFCDKLAEINLPEGLTKIGDWAFAKCYNAKTVILPSTLETLEDHAFLKCFKLSAITIPAACKEVGTSAFYQCKELKSITISEGVEVLKKGAFEECLVLENVTIPASVTTIEDYVFYNCAALATVKLNENSALNTVGKSIFNGDDNVKVIAPDGLLTAEN